MSRPGGPAVIGLLGATLACASGVQGPRPLEFATVRPPGQLEGAWVGGTDVLGGWILIEADFRRDGSRLTGELRAPSENVTRLPVTEAIASGDEAIFTFRSPFGLHRATGQWDSGMIFGRIEGDGLSGNFHLVPAAAPDPAASGRRAGSFRAGPNHHLLVTPRANGGLAWAETEPLADGALHIAGGTMYAYTADTVYTDRSIRAEPRMHEWAVFHGDSAIEWHPESRPERITRRADAGVSIEDVAFTNGGISLAGTLLLPPGPGPHPAVALVHGSGPAERTNLLSLLRADLFLRSGIGVLIWDKRGVAGSSGDWEQSGIGDLAGDAAAAVALLRAHPSVAPDRVGLFGHSQAGWVIPAAASLAGAAVSGAAGAAAGPPASPRTGADFLVVLSGGGVAPRDQEIFRAGAEAASAGLPPAEAERLMELKWEYARTGEGWEEYVGALQASDPRIVALVEAPLDRDPARWALVRRLAGYDPLPDLERIRVPVLVVFGSEDDNVPVERAAGIWRDAVPSSLLTIETVPGVGHALVGLREGTGSIFPAALVQALTDWISNRLRVRN
jgi:pimeloyl-ACP methyl ester carboxylesterase